MAQKIDAFEQIKARFDAALGHPARRRIVIWHDADGSFEGEFARMAESGLGTSRPVSFARTDEGSAFELKRRICRIEADADFLVYERAQKDGQQKSFPSVASEMTFHKHNGGFQAGFFGHRRQEAELRLVRKRRR